MNKIKNWLEKTPFKGFEIDIASADASFRKYYRISKEKKNFIVMDSSLEKDSLIPFLDITKRLLDARVNAPAILEKNLDEGFLVLEDFGSTHYLDILDKKNFMQLYKKAIDSIIKMQNASAHNLPVYDKKFLHFEMDLMEEWYISKKLKKQLSKKEKELLDNSLEQISDTILKQPQDTFVHRDFHSRNILLKDNGQLGIIDYQDAMNGNITYDLVSLLKDCYIKFNNSDIESLALYFKHKKGLKTDDKEFLKWFDFTGMQRHIKVLGIFSRLSLRDNKNGYLKDIPLTLKYLLETSAKYKETQNLNKLLTELTK